MVAETVTVTVMVVGMMIDDNDDDDDDEMMMMIMMTATTMMMVMRMVMMMTMTMTMMMMMMTMMMMMMIMMMMMRMVMMVTDGDDNDCFPHNYRSRRKGTCPLKTVANDLLHASRNYACKSSVHLGLFIDGVPCSSLAGLSEKIVSVECFQLQLSNRCARFFSRLALRCCARIIASNEHESNSALLWEVQADLWFQLTYQYPKLILVEVHVWLTVASVQASQPQDVGRQRNIVEPKVTNPNPISVSSLDTTVLGDTHKPHSRHDTADGDTSD